MEALAPYRVPFAHPADEPQPLPYLDSAATTLRPRAVIDAVSSTGSFLDGLVHIGMKNFAAGRLGDAPAKRLSAWFKAQGVV